MQLTTVEFHGDTLIGVRNGDGEVVIAVRPIVVALKLNWSGQEQKIKSHDVLSEGVCVTHTPLGSGEGQEMVCLRLDLINFWLATISTKRIKDPDIRQRVILYQKECAKVLYQHFQGGGAVPAAKPRTRGFDHPLLPEVMVRVAAEIRQSCGILASTEYLIEHAENLGIGKTTAEIARNRRQYTLPF
jgi:hypothetical protein